MKCFNILVAVFYFGIILTGCHYIIEKNVVLDTMPKPFNDLYKCNQIYITDSNIYLLYYNYATAEAYNPFAVEPYIICYNKEGFVQTIEQIDAYKIISIKSDTIFLTGKKKDRPRRNNQKLKGKYHVEFLSSPTQTIKIYNKVIDVFKLDTLTMNVYVEYREYDDLTIGFRDPLFFQDCTLSYTIKKKVFKLSDFIFHPTRDCCDTDNQIRFLHYSSVQTIDETMLFDNTNILQDFYMNLLKQLDYINPNHNTNGCIKKME